MAIDMNDIFKKVKKLRRLGDSDNANESAAALGKAAALMEKYAIIEADLGEADESAPTEAKDSVFESKRIIAWRSRLAYVLERATGCFSFFRHGIFVRLVVVGRESDVVNFRRLFKECGDEIDRLTRIHSTGLGRRWANSFRGGCVHAIHLAIKAEREALREELQGTVTETALVVVDTRADEAKAAGPDNLTSGRPSNERLDYEARETGIAAGSNIYGSTKGRIATPQRRITS